MSSEPQRHASTETAKASKPSKKVKKSSADAPVPKKPRTDKRPPSSPQRSQPSNPTLSPNRRSESPVSVSSEPRSVPSIHGSREDLASLYRDLPLARQFSPRRTGTEGTESQTFQSYHHVSAPYWQSMPGVAQDSSANPEPSARKHSDKRRRSVSPKGDLPSSKQSRHDTVAASDTAQGDHSARSSRPCHSADSLPSSSDPWMVPRSPYHPFPVPGYPPYPGYPVPPPFVPPPMFPMGPYWPPSYAMPPPPPDPRLYEDNRSRDRGSDPPRKATQKTKHLRSPPSSESERPAPTANSKPWEALSGADGSPVSLTPWLDEKQFCC
ncbi:hypothetical protein JRQ81_010732 [Phrynocephalus forsythii]|uniref:Uncharacterized protein n=1 Tax=Phrynocephalus forsythii TaxID=171643 RepID=A0A9Q0Y0A8_9SAUR|nr:hypothetical protein JRQ81_010732 [Phrynocephalus forsythii]